MEFQVFGFSLASPNSCKQLENEPVDGQSSHFHCHFFFQVEENNQIGIFKSGETFSKKNLLTD